MKMRIVGVALVAAFGLTGSALAANEQMGQEMTPPRPGPEAKALASFFGAGATWTGKVSAGALAPDSPEMTSHGKATCHEVLGGFWYAFDIEDVMGSGDQATTWKGLMLVGYDGGEGTYRAVIVDNMGGMTLYDGEMDEESFVLETPEAVMMMGQMVNDRLTWEKQEDGTLLFTDEHQMGDEEEWQLFESAVMRPIEKDQAAGTTKKK